MCPLATSSTLPPTTCRGLTWSSYTFTTCGSLPSTWLCSPTWCMWRLAGLPSWQLPLFVTNPASDVSCKVVCQTEMCDHHSCRRLISAAVTDKCVKVMMNKTITGISVIKMYAWEYAFKRVVTRLRRSSDTLFVKLP